MENLDRPQPPSSGLPGLFEGVERLPKSEYKSTEGRKKRLRESVDQQSSYMIPGPPALSDGIEPDFEVWKSKIENKLQVNADHISTPELQMAYVFSRCEGPAAQHLAPRMGSDATLRFKNATDMIAHLNTIYGVPSRSDQVFSQYRDVSMEYGQRFIEFFPTFSLLAERAKIPEERRKGDLLRKLSSDLRVRMTGNFQNKSYYELVEICKAMEYHQLNHQDRR